MRSLRLSLVLLFGTVSVLAETSSVQFEDVTEAAGLRFVHYNGATDEKYMVETMGSGGGFLDYDGDGDLDIYLLNGAALPGSEPPPTAEAPANALFRNDGSGRFANVTASAGVGHTGYGMGLAVGDVDNDGDPDLFVTNFGPDVFYLNNGDGTFSETTEQAGLAIADWSSSAAFADFDSDGFLDLYVGRYVDFRVDNHKFCGNQAKNIKAYCHPDVYDPTPSLLMRGRGDGTFEDVTEKAGVFYTNEGKTLGAVWGDYDNDGDVDLYVANDSMRNFLFRNEGDGHFEDVTLLAGVGYSEDGRTQAGMGTDMADYDGDGFLDITVTNLDFEYNAIYRGTSSGIFFDSSYGAGVAEASLNFVGFGTFFFDYDNDGLEDLFVANGHIIDNIHLFNAVSTYEEPNFLFRNEGRGMLVERSAELGSAMTQPNVARGAVPGDVDRDGDLDVLVTRCGQSMSLMRNHGGNEQSSLRVRLIGTRSNRDGIGARVTVRTGTASVMKEVKSGQSYLSTTEPVVHFGLGESSQVEEVVVRWPNGAVETVEKVGAGQLLLKEGYGSP